MPGGDRTGPRGLGPMTGRMVGHCTGHELPNWSKALPQYGMRFRGRSGGWTRGHSSWSHGGRGRGGHGHGWRRRFFATGLPFWAREGAGEPEPAQKLAGLKQEAERLREQLEEINRQIEGLESLEQ